MASSAKRIIEGEFHEIGLFSEELALEKPYLTGRPVVRLRQVMDDVRECGFQQYQKKCLKDQRNRLNLR